MAMHNANYKKKYPVLLIPGIGSSALSVWESEYCQNWVGERIWLDFSKVGTQIKLPNLWESTSETMEEFGLFVRHMLLSDDGFSDPPGIRVRPMEGLEAVSCLSSGNRLTSGLTTIFKDLIQNLLDLGYDRKSIAAAPYDWRLPTGKLEERDGFFTQLKTQIKNLYKMNNNEKVVLICHSNGNRIAHYFTNWIKSIHGEEWISKHIESLICLSAPYLGAPKLIRAVITGDALGLDIILEGKEKEAWGRHMGSFPCLLPIQEHLLPSKLLMLYTGSSSPSMKESKHALTYHGHINQSSIKKHPWREYILTNKTIQLSLFDEEFLLHSSIEINPYNYAGTWINESFNNSNECDDLMNTLSVKLKDKEALHVIVNSLLLFSSKKEIIQTARNGFRITYPENDDISPHSFPFIHNEKQQQQQQLDNEIMHGNISTFLVHDGKIMKCKYKLPFKFTLFCFISIFNHGNSLKKNIFILHNKQVVFRIENVFNRETPILAVQQCIKNDNTEKIGKYSSPKWKSFISSVLPQTFHIFERFFEQDDFIIGNDKDTDKIHEELSDSSDIFQYPILSPPVGISKLLCIYGTEVDTEVSYYLAKKEKEFEMNYHSKADSLSLQVCDSNPAGLFIKNGIGYETKATCQPCLNGLPNSGDGTVPYASLSHCRCWTNLDSVNVDIIEVPGAEHTEMLQNPEVIFHILKSLC